MTSPEGRLVADFDVGRSHDHSEFAVSEAVGGRFVCRLQTIGTTTTYPGTEHRYLKSGADNFTFEGQSWDLLLDGRGFHRASALSMSRRWR